MRKTLIYILQQNNSLEIFTLPMKILRPPWKQTVLILSEFGVGNHFIVQIGYSVFVWLLKIWIKLRTKELSASAENFSSFKKVSALSTPYNIKMQVNNRNYVPYKIYSKRKEIFNQQHNVTITFYHCHQLHQKIKPTQQQHYMTGASFIPLDFLLNIRCIQNACIDFWEGE